MKARPSIRSLSTTLSFSFKTRSCSERLETLVRIPILHLGSKTRDSTTYGQLKPLPLAYINTMISTTIWTTKW